MDRRNFIVFAAGASSIALAGLDSSRVWARARQDEKAFRPDLLSGRQFVDLAGTEAVVAGYPLSWWERNYGLPLHVHYGPVIQDNVRAFRGVFKRRYPNAEIRFAAKANPHPAVFRLVIDAGEGVDVASEFEAEGALRAGADPRRLDANGNAKSDDFIRMAVGRDMLIISDSLQELELIGQVAEDMRVRPRVMQRLSGFSLGNVTAAGSFTAGSWTKFGLNVADIGELFAFLARKPPLDFQGFHVHIGSPIATLEPYRIVAGKLVELSQDLMRRGYPCRTLNLGGGYPVNYLSREQWNTLLAKIRRGHEAARRGDPSRLWVWHDAVGGFQDETTGEIDLNHWTGAQFYSDHPKEKMIDDLLAGAIRVRGREIPFVRALEELGSPTLVIEPGRSLAEDSGVTLARVGHVKRVAGLQDLVMLEAGVVNYADALDFTIPANRWSLASGLRRPTPGPFSAFVAGHLCFTGDMPSRYKVELARKPERGDVLLTWDTGAYGPHFYAANTNAFPRPARVIVQRNGTIEYIKLRDTVDQVYST